MKTAIIIFASALWFIVWLWIWNRIYDKAHVAVLMDKIVRFKIRHRP